MLHVLDAEHDILELLLYVDQLLVTLAGDSDVIGVG
jgi:hypothetical protein